MKKYFLLSVTLMFMCATACNSSKTEPDYSVKSTPETKINDTKVADTSEEVEKEDVELNTTIEQQVVFEQDGIIVTATGLDFDGFMGPEIKFLIENNTEKNLIVQDRNVSVNGYMVDTSMSAEVLSGKKSNDSLTISSVSIDDCGIEDIAYIDFSLHIFNDDSWDDAIDTEMIHIDTSCADSYAQSYDDTGEIIYENNGIKVVAKGIWEDLSLMGPSLLVYAENNSDDEITIQSIDVSINGFMVETVFSCEIMPGKKAIDTITFMSSDIEENQIESIDEVEMSLHIFRTDDWETIEDTEPIKLEFE